MAFFCSFSVAYLRNLLFLLHCHCSLMYTFEDTLWLPKNNMVARFLGLAAQLCRFTY